jgi:hypothetical protein
LVCPPPGADRASIPRYGWILLNRRRRPLPLLSFGRCGPRVKCAMRARASVWTSGCSTVDVLLAWIRWIS